MNISKKVYNIVSEKIKNDYVDICCKINKNKRDIKYLVEQQILLKRQRGVFWTLYKDFLKKER